MNRMRAAAMCGVLLLSACPGAQWPGAGGRDDDNNTHVTTDAGPPRGAVGQECLPGAMCDSGLVCEANRCVAGASGYTPGEAAALSAAEIGAAAGCARLYSDCAELCDDPWVYCGRNQQECIDNYARDVVDDVDNPVSSSVLATVCANEIRTAACTDLRPDTPACDNAVIEGCPDDTDAYGMNYSHFTAGRITPLPSVLDLYMCDGVAEWFSVELQAGDELAVSVLQIGAGTFVSLDAELYKPPRAADAFPDELNRLHLWPRQDSPDSWQGLLPAVATAGEYLVRLELSDATGAVRVGLGTRLNPPASNYGPPADVAADAYDVLCARLHGDCASLCDSADVSCGASALECSERFSRAVADVYDSESDLLSVSAAAACGQQLTSASCASLAPVSAECSEVLLEGCEGDALTYARPTTWRMASPVTPPQTVELHVCDDVSHWFRVPMTTGQTLTLTWTNNPSSGWLNAWVYHPTTTEQGFANRDWLVSTSISVNDPENLATANATGEYYVELEYNNATGVLPIAFGVQ